MIELGTYNKLKIDRLTSPGAFLTDEEGNDILLPNKYLPARHQVGDLVRVFVYKDSEDRAIATTLHPYIIKNTFGYLKVKQVNQTGAFLDWGLEKDLLVPFREQKMKMEKDRRYLIYLYEDEQTKRLVATAKVNKYFQNEQHSLTQGDEVNILISHKTDLGTQVIIENKYVGLIFDSENYQDLMPGDKRKAFIKQVRPDHKIDVSLRKTGLDNLNDGAQTILQALEENNGYLSLTDDSSPDEIQFQLEMSKKNFKRSVGILFKQGKVTIESGGIRLKE